jgi:hypothetical protein
MSEDTQVLADSQTAEAINATAVATEAIQKANVAQISAAVETAIASFFDRGVQQKKFIDVGRIPFICDDLHGVHEENKEIRKIMSDMNDKLDNKYVTKEQFGPVRYLVFGAVIMILIAFFSVLVLNVIPHAQIALP